VIVSVDEEAVHMAELADRSVTGGSGLVGPFTGSLSAYLWFHAARSAGVRPSLKESTQLGVALAPLTMGGALAALAIVDPSAL
jgi:hypothetical protein